MATVLQVVGNEVKAIIDDIEGPFKRLEGVVEHFAADVWAKVHGKAAEVGQVVTADEKAAVTAAHLEAQKVETVADKVAADVTAKV